MATLFTMAQIAEHLEKRCGFNAYRDEDGSIDSLDKNTALHWNIKITTDSTFELQIGKGRVPYSFAFVDLRRDDIHLGINSMVINHIHFDFN